MYEKLSERVDRVIKLSRSIARQSDQEYLGTEHVLLAIRNEGTGLGAELLKSFDVDEHRLKSEIDQHIKKSMEETWIFGNLPGSPHLKSVVAGAITLAQELGSSKVCTEHLLLAMLAEEGSVAEVVMRNLGVSFDEARKRLVEMPPPT
jgi:ATP-dependent Clp protease ATP-binding subunit ClpC